MKQCSKCKEVKMIVEFYKNKDKQCSQCKLCFKKYNQEHKEKRAIYDKLYNQEHKEEIAGYYQDNKEKILTRIKKYNQEHRKENIERDRKYYQDNKEDILKNSRNYNQNNKEKTVKHRKKYNRNNKEKIAVYNKKHYQENKKQVAIYNKKYNQEHRKEIAKYENNLYRTNISYKLRSIISAGINQSLKKKNLSKNSNSFLKLIGFTILELKNHLELQFQLGMSWDNYGLFGWHIDHIRPVSSFNITSVNSLDFKKCWCLENLQPLWAEDNLRKSNKYTTPGE